MNLDQFKNWALASVQVGNPNPGNTYLGQCVSLVQNYINKVYGIGWTPRGDAKDWATNGNVLSYFDKVSSPQAGDIGIMGAPYGSDGKGNYYGHIFIYTSPNTILEQNGRVPLRVSTGAAYPNPIAILRRKGTTGGNGVIIGNGENWYGRLNKLHNQVRGRDLDRATFNAFVGQDTLKFMEAVSDDPEADAVQNWQNVGRVAVQDKWDQQIYTLQDQLKAANQKLVELAQKPVPVPPSTIDQTTKDQIAETNNIVKQIWNKISSIFK